MKISRWNIGLSLILTFCLMSSTAIGQSSSIPTPESVIGFRPGTDYKLANWEQISSYFFELAKSSNRVEVQSVGTTEMENQVLMAYISSEENLRNKDLIKEIQKKLADPRKTSDSELPILLRDGKVVVLMSFSLHGTEVGASQMSSILAYELATKNDEITRQILDNVFIVMFPSTNPDGVMLVADHYMAQNPGPGVQIQSLPRVYNKYTGHDNNRDWYMITQKEHRFIADQMYKEWLPEIVYDMHQMGNGGARFFLPPFADPLNPEIDPLVVRELLILGGYFATDLIAGGYPWVENMRSFSMWWHGGMRTAPYFHNMVGILTEAASANLASPIPPSNATYPDPTISYPVPWKHDRPWTIGEIVEQDRIASLALLKGAARNRDMFLSNFYSMNKKAIEIGTIEAPYAYVISADQHDPGAARYFTEVMLRQKTEFHEALEPFTAGGKRYPAGSIIAYLAQPSRAHVKAIFDVQKYPAGRNPYDVTGWTLPVQMGVQYDRVDSRFSARTKPYTEAVHKMLGSNESKVKTYVINSNSIDHYVLLNRLFRKGHKVKMLTESGEINGNSLPAGTKFIKQSGNLDRDLQEITPGLTIEINGMDGSVNGSSIEIEKPEIAIVDDPSSMPIGWLRWIMDTNDFDFSLITGDDFLEGGLNKKYDIVLFTDRISDQTQSSGRRGGESMTPPDFVVDELKRFVEDEGVVVSWGRNADYVADALELSFTSATSSGDEFNIPGSVLKISVNTDSPFTFGMQEEGYVFFNRNCTAWNTVQGQSLGRYASGNPLFSGFANGGELIGGKPNIVHEQIGKGDVLLIGFDPVFRAQPVANFKLLFNAILYAARK
ncbi:M14 family zinc carboxypeptidase [candidate division KSB1 bacterium]